MKTVGNNTTNFTGLLYGKIGNHTTKPILCCPHGDAKFVRFINKISETKTHNPIKIEFSDQGLTKLIVETEDFPKLNFMEKLLYNTNKLQTKALKMRKNGIIQRFIYQLNELEFKNLKEDYLFISKKQINKFIKVIKNHTPQDKLNFIEKFFK